MHIKPDGLLRRPEVSIRPTSYLPLIAIRRTFCCAVGDFGRVTLRIPS